ncbi:hypothetical protein RJ639_034409 [Escallonia herrerae]|uniref:11-beta-hydroxysteroid dehydrogenase 1B-like n=1 Tax=Escallonia herrerae TaxID=1293975 RepID=A0AA89B834_9ASTE|nr:hypothetical protein RJ639_034409 [Escallonia herrerae]
MGRNHVIHHFINALAKPLLFVCLCLLLPIFFIFKFLYTFYLYHCNENMEGKVVIVTGASSGIGEQLSYEYAKKGARLMIVARREERLQQVAETARGLGSPDVVPICADVSNVNDCKRFVDATIKHFGRLDHLVNNAGISSVCSVEDTTDISKFVPLMDINFWGCVYPTYFAIPYLKKTRGKIIVNSSVSAILHPPTLAIYSVRTPHLLASKAALLSFYEALRVELAPAITITIATLGIVETEIIQGKHLSKEGVLRVDPQLADALNEIIKLPVMSSQACAKAVLDAVGRGERNVTEPKWYKAFVLLKGQCPEVTDWCYRTFYFKRFSSEKMNAPIPLSQDKAS